MPDVITEFGSGGITVIPPSSPQHLRVGTSWVVSSVSASGGTGPYTHSIYQGSLPPGVSMSSAGAFSGTHSSYTGSEVYFLCEDSTGARNISGPITFTSVDVLAISGGFDTATNIHGSTTEALSVFLYAVDGRPDSSGQYTWSIQSVGALPTGLSLDTATGEISGTPSSAATSGAYVFRVTDENGTTADTANVVFVIDAITSGPTTTITGTTYTQTPTDASILVDDDTAGGAVTITLLAASEAGDGKTLEVKKLGTTGSVTIDGSGSETIDGATTKVLSTQYDSIIIRCDGSSWFIVGDA